jgi:hypothetical protein
MEVNPTVQGYRVFLQPGTFVPGYVAGPGKVMLPLKLDGGMEEMSVEVKTTDPAELAKDLQRITKVSDHPSFIVGNTRFKLYATKGEYEAKHRPAWIERTAQNIGEIIENYAQGEGAALTAFTDYDLVGVLKTNWQRLAVYTGSLLYMGHLEGGVEGISKTSYMLFGGRLDEDIQGQLNFMENLYHIDHAFYRRLRQRYAVHDPDGTVNMIHEADVFKGQIATAGLDDDGTRHDLTLESDERALEMFERNEDGNIESESERVSNLKYESAIMYAATEASRNVGTFAFARMNVSVEEIYSLLGTEGCPMKVVFSFLVMNKGVHPDIATRLTNSVVWMLGHFKNGPVGLSS